MIQPAHVTVQMATVETPVEVSALHGVQQMTHYLCVKWSCGLLQYLMQLCTRIIFSMANLQHLLCDVYFYDYRGFLCRYESMQ